MFLSHVEVPWEFARNPYDFHRLLWRLFPGEAKETRRKDEEKRQGFLFRVEENPTGRPARLLVQSRMPPRATSGLVVLATREFHPQPIEGQRLAFVLTANPIKTIADAQREAKPGKISEKCRVPLIRETDQRDWVTRKLSDAAEILTAEVLPHAPMYFRKGDHSGKLIAVTFNGMLKVVSPGRLTEVLENGVGPAKGFGCGLLLVRRA
jgi:CRISPR system Cascade subunit CasE